MTREKIHRPENVSREAVNVGKPYMHDGKRWISASAVAAIWNYRARVEYAVEGTNYTRFSVGGRREDRRKKQVKTGSRAQLLTSISIPNGPQLEKHFYDEEEAWTIPLSPHPNRRQINTSGIRKDPVSGQFLSKTENS